MSDTWWAERAWLGGAGLEEGVVVEVGDGCITRVEAGVAQPPPGASVLRGVTLPGFANAHSHAFHRALRGRAAAAGDFWAWQQQMHELAGRLDPDSYRALARATYAEMTLAGVTCVGEFHYVHHAPDGRPYRQPNVMGEALFEAASEAGMRITLLDTCLLQAGIDEPLTGPTLRFGDGDAARWGERMALLHPGAGARVGAAIHSVRTVPPLQMREVASLAAERSLPLHLHLSEQSGENAACQARYGVSPTELLAAQGVLGGRTCAVHATHLEVTDVRLLGAAAVTVCACPTTERELGDGLSPFGPLRDAGCPLAVGTDSQAVIDLLEEARGVELHERLRSGRRGLVPLSALVGALTVDGHRSLGWPEAGRIATGAPCDLVAVATDSWRLAGADRADLLNAVVSAATAADVRDVVVGGRRVVADGHHLLVDDVAGELTRAVHAVLED